MAETVFFDRKRKGNERIVLLQTYTGLVGKAPTKAKRLKMKFQMPVSGKKMTGIPEWMVNAYDFISKNHDTVTPEMQLQGYEVNFSAEQLFGDKSVTAQKCQLRGFVMHETGDSENPDIVLTFYIYAPYSSRLNTWCGNMAGEEFWAKFTAMEEPEEEEEGGPQLVLTSEEPEPEQEQEEGEDEREEA